MSNQKLEDYEFGKDLERLYRGYRRDQWEKLLQVLEDRIDIRKTNRATAGWGDEGYGKDILGDKYDMRIWQWIDFYYPKDDPHYYVIIGLQTLGQDTETKNVHAMMGRIYIDIVDKDTVNFAVWNNIKRYNDHYTCSLQERFDCNACYEEPFYSLTRTPFNLPLREDDRVAIANYIMSVFSGDLELPAIDSTILLTEDDKRELSGCETLTE